MKLSIHRKNRGFTVIELMIATLVFSVVLMLLVFGVVYITRAYYKGLAQTKTQNAARNTMEAISGAIKFGGAAPTMDATGKPFVNGNTHWFCVGTQIIAYNLGYQLVEGAPAANQANHALVMAQLPDSNCPATNVVLSGSGISIPSGSVNKSIELLSPKMRLSLLDVKASTLGSRTWEVAVQVTYGEDDLLCNPQQVSGSCDSNVTMSAPQNYTVNAPGETVTCKSQSGSQFCAYSRLSSIVQTRIE